MANKKNSNRLKHPLVIAAIAFISLFVIFFSIIIYIQKPKIVPQNLSEATTVTINEDGTKKYTDPDGYFSFDYPANWKISFSSNNQREFDIPEIRKRQNIKVDGKEGSLELIWINSNFENGPCPTPYNEPIKMGNKIQYFCETKDYPENGQLTWMPNGILLDSTNNLGVNPQPIANAPYQENRETILKILSSFEFERINKSD